MSRMDDLIAEHCPDGVVFELLSNVGTWYGGGTPSKSQPKFWRDGTIPWVSPKDMGRSIVEETEDYITEAAIRESSAKLVPPVSIALVVRSSILDRVLPTALIPIPVALNQDMKAVVPRADTLPSYIAHLLRSRGPEILRAARKSGGSVASIESRRLFSFRIPVPPLEVQREIVSILDTFSELEAELETELKAELKARRMQYAHYRDGLLSFDRGVRDVALSEVVEFINGKPHERLVSEDGTVALLTSRFISTDGKKARYVEPDKVLTPAKVGDVSLVMSDLPNGRALARTFYIDEEGRFAANQRVCLLRVRSAHEIVPRFLHHVMDRNRQLLAYDNGTDQTHLKKGQILTMRCPVPPLAEQERIVGILDKFDAMVNDLSIGLPAELEARRKQYEHYRDRLLTFEEATA